ncbi:PBP2_Bug_TTT domain containing protein [Burkholderiaceae bacterium]
MINKLLISSLSIVLSLCGGVAHAKYPERPITMVVPFPPGGTSDLLARILAKNVGERMRVNIIVENKPGVEGQIAAQEITKANPDGYKIGLVTSGNLSALPAMRIKPPYDVVKDFTPIADIGRYAFFLYANPEVPVKNFKDFVSYAKANPGKMSYGSGNNTGVLIFAQVKQQFGIDLVHVPYKGEPPAMTDLVAGRVQAMIGTAAGLPFVKEGKLNVFVSLLPERSPLAPNVPVFKEIGLGELPVLLWAGIVGPSNMPKPIVDQLNKEFVAVLADPSVKKQIENLGFAVTPDSPQAFAKLIADQVHAYKKLVTEIGLTLQ